MLVNLNCLSRQIRKGIYFTKVGLKPSNSLFPPPIVNAVTILGFNCEWKIDPEGGGAKTQN